ncbi:hypothetical protein PR048_000581 [Dryococelus australis]|uniref:Uncharacterized protein n=1 Tax=Dryococelus australis TaxID=614101 RepID=A0ABQ9IF29_9NEOP|nr:hypothetical protein PR048_000581 [Dryococelus australis]
MPSKMGLTYCVASLPFFLITALVRLPASHQGKLGSIPGGVPPPPDSRMWESCRTMPLVGGFSRGSPSGAALYSPRFIFISSQDLDVKSCQAVFTLRPLLSTSTQNEARTSALLTKFELPRATTADRPYCRRPKRLCQQTQKHFAPTIFSPELNLKTTCLPERVRERAPSEHRRTLSLSRSLLRVGTAERTLCDPCIRCTLLFLRFKLSKARGRLEHREERASRLQSTAPTMSWPHHALPFAVSDLNFILNHVQASDMDSPPPRQAPIMLPNWLLCNLNFVQTLAHHHVQVPATDSPSPRFLIDCCTT